MFKVFTIGAVLLALTACGNEKKGIPVRLHQRTTQTSQLVFSEAAKVLPQSNGDSMVNQTIRSTIIGLSLSRNNAAAGQVQINIELSANLAYDQCKVSKFQGTGANGMDWVMINGLGRVKCLVDSNCNHLVLDINNIPGVSGTGSVPVIFEKGRHGYLPQTTSQSAVFLRLNNDTNIMCLRPSQIENYLGAQPQGISDGSFNPLTMPPSLDYYPNYNGWFE